MNATDTATAPEAKTTIVYLVAWNGGSDDPTFQSFTDEAQATETYENWVTAATDRFDRITLVEQVINADGIVTNTKVRDYCPAWDPSDN